MVVGLSDIFQVEVWEVLEGLKYAQTQVYCRVEIENDNFLLLYKMS